MSDAADLFLHEQVLLLAVHASQRRLAALSPAKDPGDRVDPERLVDALTCATRASTAS